MINRRQFSQAVAGMLAASRVDFAQTPTPVTWAGASIVDCHHHLRPSPEANIAHLDGAGISNAQALARANSAEQMQALEAKYPGRFLAWLSLSRQVGVLGPKARVRQLLPSQTIHDWQAPRV